MGRFVAFAAALATETHSTANGNLVCLCAALVRVEIDILLSF